MPKYKELPQRGNYECICQTCGKTFRRELPVDECLECRRKTYGDGTPYWIISIGEKTFFVVPRIYKIWRNKPFPMHVTTDWTVSPVLRHTSLKWFLRELNDIKPEITEQELKLLLNNALTKGVYDKQKLSDVVIVSFCVDSFLNGQDKTEKSRWVTTSEAQINSFQEQQNKLARQKNYLAHQKAQESFLRVE